MPPLPRSAKPCSASQVSVHNQGSSGRTSDRGAVLAFTNVSKQTCLLYGRPRITMRGPDYGPALLTADHERGAGHQL